MNKCASKYIIIARKDNESFEKVSPFIVKKVIDYTCDGEVEFCKKTRAGTLLVKTKNLKQANKLLNLKVFHNFPVEASEHKTLNFSKGIFYSNELRGIDEEEIQCELKSQNVTEVKKILKKDNDTLKETGLIVVTFATPVLPEEIKIGYQLVNVRPYIPQPFRCKNCLRFGHPTSLCKSGKTCPNCSNQHHTNENEICQNEKKCINCRTYNNEEANHSPLEKVCPVYKKQYEITTIKIIEKVDYKTAINLYNARHPNTTLNYEKVVKSSEEIQHKQQNNSKIISTNKLFLNKINTRSIISHNDITDMTDISELTHHSSPNLILDKLPKNKINSLTTQLKAKAKKKKT